MGGSNLSNLLYKTECVINENISIQIPTVGEVLEKENEYYSMVTVLTAMPIDLMVQLDDIGLDFSTLNDYELFLILFSPLKEQDTSLVFGKLDITHFEPFVNTENGMIVMRNAETGVVIDRGIHDMIADALRKIHHMEKNTKRPGNKEARDYMIERARKKLKRQKSKPSGSQLEDLIVSLVNTEQFKYNFETVKALTIYQFNECVRQIVDKINYDNRMHGVYAGTVSAKDLSPDDLNWLTHDKK